MDPQQLSVTVLARVEEPVAAAASARAAVEAAALARQVPLQEAEALAGVPGEVGAVAVLHEVHPAVAASLFTSGRVERAVVGAGEGARPEIEVLAGVAGEIGPVAALGAFPGTVAAVGARWRGLAGASGSELGQAEREHEQEREVRDGAPRIG